MTASAEDDYCALCAGIALIEDEDDGDEDEKEAAIQLLEDTETHTCPTTFCCGTPLADLEDWEYTITLPSGNALCNRCVAKQMHP